MSNINTQWRITVAADTARARSELKKFAKTAQVAGMSMEEIFSNVQGAPVARTFSGMGRELNRMNAAVQKSKVHMGQWNRYWQNSNNLIRYSKQLQTANTIAIERTNGAMTSATAVMQRFNRVAVSTTERLAYMNTFFRAASRQAINAAKNIQWSGRQITVGFGVPFGLAMTGASMAFFKFEEQLVRFRKVFNDEVNELSIEEAESRITNLANTMATSLGAARDEIMETSALFAQMGYKVEEIERLTKATTELAMLGETDAQEAGKLLRAYSASGFVDTFVENGGSEEEFEDYIKNMLNMIENNTGLSIASMVEAGMAQLIPLFSQMGVGSGIGESILAGMTEALGGRTSEAVTALKAIMQRVYDESAETTEQFGLIGIDIDSLQDRYKDDFVGLITELGNTLANNPDIQNNNKAVAETFGNLFGVRQANRAIAGLRAVSSAFDSSGEAANDYGRALNSIQDPQEAATRAAAELQAQAESVGGQFRRLKEAIIIEAAEIGQSFLEMIMPLVKAIRTGIEWFSNLDEGIKRMTMGFGLAVVAIGGILTTVGVLTQAVLSMARTIGFFLPKFKEWTEENLKQRIATEHVNEALKEQRTVVQSIIPVWKSIEQAQHRATQATERMTTALTEQNAVMRSTPSNSPYGGSMSYRDLNRKYGARVARNNNTIQQGPIASGPGFAPRPLSGAARQSKQLMYSNMFAPSSRDASRMEQQALITERNRNTRASRATGSVKWRGGAAAAGGLLSMSSMFVGGEGGDKMFAGGLGLQGVAMLMDKRVLDGVTTISDKLITSAKASKGLAAGMKTSAAKMLSLGGGIPAVGIAIAAVAGSAYLIAKNMRESAEAANLLTNEFEYANSLGEELGLKLSGDGMQRAIIDGMEQIDPEKFEQSSDEIKSLVADIQKVSASGGDVQRIFRNLARDWMAGGATIEQIQSSLDDLEAQIGVEITHVDTDYLQETIKNDIISAIEATTTQLMLDTTVWNDLWGSTGPFGWGKEAFGSEGTALITNRVSSLTRGMDAASGMDPDDALSFLDDIESILDRQENMLTGRNREQYTQQFDAILAQQLGIPEEITESLEDTEEIMGFYYSTLVTDQAYLNSLTEEQKETLFGIVNSMEKYTGFSSDVYSAFEGMEILSHETRKETNMLANELGRIAGYQGSEMIWSATDIVQTGDKELLRDYVTGLEDMVEEAEEGSQEMAILKAIIDQVNAALYQAPGAGHYRGMADHYSYLLPDAEEEPDENPGTTDAKDYSSAFRSEMENQRNEVVQSILDNFDEASEARMEALKDERDARMDVLEQQRDDEIEALEDARDAELDAIDERKDKIDEYIDKQKEMQEAMQDQLDLAVALASGDRAGAGQIQNAIRFGTIEDMAASEKKRLDEAKDSVKDEYDERIEARKEYHDGRIENEKEVFELRMEYEQDARAAQRESMEQELEFLENKFIGTKEGWDEYIAAVESETGQKVSDSVANGWEDGMTQVRNDIRMDGLWDQLGAAISTAITTGSVEGILQGLHDPRVRAAYGGHYTEMARQSTARGITEGVELAETETKANYPVTGSWQGLVRHSGGPIGSGAPRDVPAILQTGEYVIQRDAAKKLGPDVLAQMNNAHKYHSGGAVNSGFLGVGEHIGSIAGEAFKQQVSGGQRGGGFEYDGSPMDPSRYGGRNWGKAAANTLAAQAFISSNFTGVRGAYTSVDRGDPRSDHTYGKALDVMTANLGSYSDEREREIGWQVANFFQDNPDAFGTKYVIWQGMISSLSKDGLKKWRPYTRMSGPTGGHYDHVHLSFLHSGGEAGKDGRLGLSKGGRLKANNVPATLHRGETVLRAPVAKSLEEGIANMSAPSSSGGGLTLQIDNFHGTEANIDRLAAKVGDTLNRHHRKVNPQRSFS